MPRKNSDAGGFLFTLAQFLCELFSYHLTAALLRHNQKAFSRNFSTRKEFFYEEGILLARTLSIFWRWCSRWYFGLESLPPPPGQAFFYLYFHMLLHQSIFHYSIWHYISHVPSTRWYTGFAALLPSCHGILSPRSLLPASPNRPQTGAPRRVMGLSIQRSYSRHSMGVAFAKISITPSELLPI